MGELYEKQMAESLFHNDETRWEVFVKMEGKVGTHWYLWVTRSESVIYFILDPSRSAAVPQEHFAGLQLDKVILVVDRYSSYKKLARLSDIILLAFCCAHVRRWEGGTLFVEPPQVPLDNNIAENTIRGPVTGRKNYYGSGLWSALLAAIMFSILKAQVLWNINPRHWITDYLTAYAENGGVPPEDLAPFIPWKITEARRKELSPPPRINNTS